MHSERLYRAIAIAALSCAGLTRALNAAVGGVQVWPVDPLVKVFRDARPARPGEAIAEVARGEHASLQVVVRADADTKGLRAKLSPVVLEGGDASLTSVTIRFVGYVPVDRAMQWKPKPPLHEVPDDFPDPLLEEASIDVKAGQAQPIWITVAIPLDARPGVYRSTAQIQGTAGGEAFFARQALKIRVYKAAVGRPRIWLTNHFGVISNHMKIHPKSGSEAYDALMRRYARNMAAHRQNVALISPMGLASFRVGADGQLDVDFSRFDKWVEIFKEEGVIGRIEGGYVASRQGEFYSPYLVRTYRVVDGKVRGARVKPTSPEAHRFYGWYLPVLVKHLRERGWLDCYMQHLGDEPILTNDWSYRQVAELFRKYGPELRLIDAVLSRNLVGAVDIWVPRLDLLGRDWEFYRARQKAGDELWQYVCVFPQRDYANRFIEQRVLKLRLLYWINYRYGLTGYLHWGYNRGWGSNPFTHTTLKHPLPDYLPAGDAWIVYPGKDGPLDSIRHEAQRDGVDDHTLLSQLGERDPAAAKRLVSKHVLDFDQYDTDVEAFRVTRREILELLSK